MTALSVTATWLLRYEKDNPLAAGMELIRHLEERGYVVTRKEADTPSLDDATEERPKWLT